MRKIYFLCPAGLLLIALSACNWADSPTTSASLPPPTVTVSQPIQRQVIEWNAHRSAQQSGGSYTRRFDKPLPSPPIRIRALTPIRVLLTPSVL